MKFWLALGAAIVLAGLLTIWWKLGGREQTVLALQPKFRVVSIDTATESMTLQRLNETLVVRCGSECGKFATGKSYSMLDRGGILKIRMSGRDIELPVIQEHVNFDTVTGGRG